MPLPKTSEITLNTTDNIKISANHYKNNFKNAIIICPGFMMYKDSKPFSMLSQKLSESFDIITMDFRGHGRSKGVYTFTSCESRDLKSVLDYTKPKYSSIGILGFSLGAAVAINETALSKSANKLMVVSAPSEFGKIENRFLNKDIIVSTIKKFEWGMGCTRLGNVFLKKARPIDNIDKISPVPILFVHGKKDTIIRPWHSDSLYKKAKDPKRLVIYEKCLHAEDIFLGDKFEDFITLCKTWFNKEAS